MLSFDTNTLLIIIGLIVGIPLGLLLLIKVIKGLVQLAYTLIVFGAAGFVAYYLGTPEGSALLPRNIDVRVVQAVALIFLPLAIVGGVSLFWYVTKRAFRAGKREQATSDGNNPYARRKSKREQPPMPAANNPYAQQQYPPQGYAPPPTQYPPQGYAPPPAPQQPYPQQQYPPQGYAPPPAQYPPQGYAPPPAPPQAYPPQQGYPPPQGYTQPPPQTDAYGQPYPPQAHPPQPPYPPPAEPGSPRPDEHDR